MSTFEKDKDIMNGKGENDVEWITVNGVHIPIKDGESKQEAIEKHFGNKKGKSITLPKQEYAELCSAIKTRYGNRIPKNGDMLYGNYFYCYNYNNKNSEIKFSLKIQIEGNEDIIARKGGKYVKY